MIKDDMVKYTSSLITHKINYIRYDTELVSRASDLFIDNQESGEMKGRI